MSRTHAALAVCIAGVLGSALLLAQAKPTKTPKAPPPITIDIAGVKDDVTSIQTAGAWPLDIRLVANDPLGVSTYIVPNEFPIDPQQAFIIFSDPDNCLSLVRGHDPDLVPANLWCPGGTDETYLEFTPTINLPNLARYLVDKVMPAPLGPKPTLNGWSISNPNNDLAFKVGPDVGDEVSDCTATNETYPRGCDNYGYGASPNIPGLVILSDTGLGLVWDEDFTLASPRAARNLAGFVNSVSWTLNDCIGWKTLPDGCANGRTSVTAHINVPATSNGHASLFAPVVRIDFGHPAGWPSGPLNLLSWPDRAYQIDGGPWVDDPSLTLRSVLNAKVTTLRIFVVSGKAPDTLVDLDGDGVVTSKDARLAGYTLLTGDKLVRFRTFHQEEESAIGIPFDHYLNGMVFPTAPAGSGDIRTIPR